MKTEVRRQWTAALRSGEYRQAQHVLRNKDGFCCWGVLCDLAAKNGVIPEPERIDEATWLYDGDQIFPSKKVLSWAGITSMGKVGDYTLIGWNDDLEANFPEIADLIDEHLSEDEGEQLEIPANV